jgi:serine protease AprX
MRRVGMTNGARSSALWGKRSGSRSSALWGKGGRGIVALALGLVVTAALTAPVATAKSGSYHAFVTPTLLTAATNNPDKVFTVIVSGERGKSSSTVVTKMHGLLDGEGHSPKVNRQFALISGASVELTGREILKLAEKSYVDAITPDSRVELAGPAFSNKQKWALVSGVSKFWRGMEAGLTPPAIAIVDSGIQANRADFANGAQIRKSVVITNLPNNSAGDGRGHGTFVAGIAAGQAPDYAGALPGAPIVSLDVMDDKGMANTSDVIAAADWIYQNKGLYNIKVANFSLHSSVQSSFMYDPLDKAVEKLWFSGVTVVAAAGNYGVAGKASGVPFAPGNDPFVITVGANDIDGSVGTNDDLSAPWSAYGYTLDGFAKPEIGAPGRYMIGPVPTTSTLLAERPTQARATGYMELSGTSFAAPLVSGVAAYIMAMNPTWTPDQVKGALMLTARPLPSAAPLALGVGEMDAPAATSVTNAPNANLALNQFKTLDPTGGTTPVFDAASWANASWANASWASASWASASWASASWASASWANASWASASWASASWASTAEAAASWASASWASSSYEDNAEGEEGVGGELMTDAEYAQALIDLGLAPQLP